MRPEIYLPEGTEICDTETGELLAVTTRDLNRFERMRSSDLDWVGEEPGDLVPRRYMRAITAARRKYLKEIGDA